LFLRFIAKNRSPMKQKIYQVDAFAEKVFSGNPAAVCPLSDWLSDELMQQIAMENNLSETVFYVKKEEKVHIRWFTPMAEVDLCGHATLAAAYVLFYLEGQPGDHISFFSHRSGDLTVQRKEDLLTLNFPSDEMKETELTEALLAAFDIRPKLALKGRSDYLLVFENEQEVKSAQADLRQIAGLDCRGLIITARGEHVDFVSRFFAPQLGVDEDPVTGSAHTSLIPFWAKRLGKVEMTARQLSRRRGDLLCRYLDDRVEIAGKAKLYLQGEIFI
jgi:PhzF family phenazine biosynthesis protein